MHNLRPSFEHSFRKTRNCFVQDSFLSNLVAHKRLSPRSKHSPLLSTQRSIINIRVAEPEIVLDRKFRSSLYQTSLRRLKKQHTKSTLEDPPKLSIISPALQEQLIRQKRKRYSQVKKENTISLEANQTDHSIFSIWREKRSSRRNLDLSKRQLLLKNYEEQQQQYSQQSPVFGRLKAYNQNDNSLTSTLMLQTFSPPAMKITKRKGQSYICPFQKGFSIDSKLPAVLCKHREPAITYKAFSYEQKDKQKLKKKQPLQKEKMQTLSLKFSPFYFH